MVDQAKEAQDLTDKVLNIRFALEKLTAQKTGLEQDIKVIEAKHATLLKDNENYVLANKEFEKKIADLNVQCLAKQVEIEQAKNVYKDEIDKKFQEIEDTKAKQDRKEKELIEKENQVMRAESVMIEQQKNNESSVLQAEHMEKQNAIKEVELKRIAENQTIFQEVLKGKEEQITVKEGHLANFEKSLMDREATLIGKLSTLDQREHQLTQLKNAIENDKTNLENDKNRNSYVLRVLNDVQTRCITNVGQKITEDTINSIKDKILDISKPTIMEPSLVDKSILNEIPTTIEVPAPAIQPTVEDNVPPMVEDEAVADMVPEEKPGLTAENQGFVEQTEAPVQETEETSTDETDMAKEPGIALEDMSQEDLLIHAKEMGINAMKNWKKETIIAKIQAKVLA